jgi:capping protein (actin filament) muscle Z-line, alpha
MEIDGVKLRVIQYFLKNTPVGEHKEVINDLQSIIGGNLVRSDAVADILLESLAFHGTTIPNEAGLLQLTTIGRNGFQFFDPKYSATFDVNPFDLTISNFQTVTSGSTLSRLIQEKLDKYLALHFSETAQGRVFQNDEVIFVFIACPSVNLRNMWTGEWIGDWKISEGKIEGKVNINAHYFEEGNLQLSQNREFSKDIKGNSEESWADEIIKTIKESDNSVQNGMYEIYDNLPQNVFKPMRRTMPVTQVKFADMNKNKMLS